MKRIGLLGGAFDPPHLGHREAVESLLRNPGVRNVIILPSGNPPLKEYGDVLINIGK